MTASRRVTCLLFAAAASASAASAFLVFEAQRGVPFRFGVELGLAVLVALVLPLTAVAAMRRFSAWRSTGSAFAVFYAVSLAITACFALAARFI